MKFENYLLNQSVLHPFMQAQDIVKLCYQVAFGPAHLFSEGQSLAEKHFQDEFLSVPPKKGRLYEMIAPDVCRVGFSEWKQRQIPQEWLFRMLQLSVSETFAGEQGFNGFLDASSGLIHNGELPVSEEDWKKYLKQYLGNGIHPVRHSPEYNSREKPAYCVLYGNFVRLFGLLEKISVLPRKNGSYTIAIDGRCASGKTTMAKQLENIIGAGIIHMDDFFLPEHLRTKERLRQPGGNVHYERFACQVLNYLPCSKKFSYQTFNCKEMKYGAFRIVRETKWHVVEGAYCCHPSLGKYMDLCAFSDVGKKEQMARIRKRNGEEAVFAFAEKWIPMEENYFKSYSIKERADIVL